MKMKKIILLGDSIRMGYQTYVKEELEGEYEVIFSKENGRFSAYTLWQLNQLLKEHSDAALIHWNNGYWDMNTEPPMTEPFTPLDDYVKNLGRIIKLIRQTTNAKIIFANTVPMLDAASADDNTGTGGGICIDDEKVRRYNMAAEELMAKEQIRVNDLYSLCLAHPRRHKCDDMLHLTEKGSRECAKQIAKIVRETLK